MIDRLVIIAFVALLGISLAVAAALLRARTDAARLLPRIAIPAQPPGDGALHVPPASDDFPTLILAPAPSTFSTLDLPPPDDVPDGVDWLAQAIDELRTPLGILRGQVEALRHAVPDGPRQTLVTLAERLVDQVEQAQALVAAWSASAHGSMPQLTNSRAQAVDLVALARRMGTEHDALTCDVAPTPPVWAMLDPVPLARALAVTLQSARTAAPAGTVEVVARVVGRDPDRRIGITIADRRPAQSSPSARLWDDLELDLTRALLEDCGGWVACEPRGGGGRLVTLWLPGALLCDAEIQPALPRSA